MEEIRYSSAEVALSVLPEAGARIHRLRVFGHDLLRTPDKHARHLDDTFFWGAYVMAPWCGRIAASPTRMADASVEMAANFGDGTAIHGQVYATQWQADARGGFTASGGGDGWPWPYSVAIRYGVDGASLVMDLALTNMAGSAMPAGIGLHPWFHKPVEVTINGAAVFDSNSDSPALPRTVAGEWDRRVGGPMPDGLDATWTDLSDPLVTLRWPETGVRADLRTTEPGTYIVAASPSELDAIAVEPQTHAPQGVRRLLNREPGALRLLAPGATLNLTTQLTFTLEE
jgi:aldose 1-epimerase